VARFGRGAPLADQELPVDYETTSDPSAHCEVDNIPLPARGAAARLGQTREVGVIAQHDREAGADAQLAGQGDVDPARQIGRFEYDPAARIERARRRDAQADDGVTANALPDIGHSGNKIADNGLGSAVLSGRSSDSGHDAGGTGDGGNAKLGSPEVYSDGHGLAWCHALLLARPGASIASSEF